jgi:hypothetical protein
MKTFKSFIQLDEVERAKYKEGIANKLSGVSYLAQTKDPGDLEHVGPEEIGPKAIKTASGKRPADRLDNKQPFGEDVELNEDDLHPEAHKVLKHIKPEHQAKYKADLTKKHYTGSYSDRSAVLKAASSAGHMKEEVEELDEISSNLAAKAAAVARAKRQNSLERGNAVAAKAHNDQANRLQVGSDDRANKETSKAFSDALKKARKRIQQSPLSAVKKRRMGEEIDLDEAGSNLALRGLFSTDPKKAGQFLSTEKGKQNRAKKNVPELKAAIQRQLGRHPKPNLPEEVEELGEEDFSPKQTKMAHTIGKEFAKKKVGDQYKGGPYAVASAMVKNKPESAQKAYNTIKAKMKEEADADLLYKVYNDLNEQNRIVFMNRLETDADDLLQFAKHMED